MGDSWSDRDVAEKDRSSDRASSILLVGFARIPSYFDPGRYRRMPANSSGLAWLLGVAGLLVPLFSIAGVYSGYRATRRGNRLGIAAAIWCVLTATVSVALWAPVFTDDGTPCSWPQMTRSCETGSAASSPSPLELTATHVNPNASPPEDLTFASTSPPTHYAELDVEVANHTSDDVPLSPSSIEVEDGSGRRLAWATTDETFLATTSLPGGESSEIHLYVALPTGASMASVSVGDAQIDL